MKKLCFSAFIAFWSSIATMVAIQVLADQNEGAETSEKTYTLAEVAEHDTKDDCWMVIENKVYDFTAYLLKHPAGPGTMIPWCGLEATEAMRNKGYGVDHSDFAWRQMEKYFIGTLK